MRRVAVLFFVCWVLLSFPLLEGCSRRTTQPTAPRESYQLVTAWGDSGTGNGQFWIPWGVAVDASGDVYISDAGNHRIQKFNSSGSYLAQWGDSGSANGQFDFPKHVAVDSSGDVYVVDCGNYRVQKFAGNGAYLTQWGTYGTGNGQFSGPWGVAADRTGNVYVTDSNGRRVEKFSSTGAFLAQWAVPTLLTGAFESPHGVAVDDSGNVYVVVSNNSAGGHPCVMKFAGDGTLLTQWGWIGSGNGQFFDPDGIAVDAAGNVYVTDTENWRIQKFTRMGQYLTQWSSGRIAKGVGAPGGIAADGLGNVYVAEWNFFCRVQKFAPTGAR